MIEMHEVFPVLWEIIDCKKASSANITNRGDTLTVNLVSKGKTKVFSSSCSKKIIHELGKFLSS